MRRAVLSAFLSNLRMEPGAPTILLSKLLNRFTEGLSCLPDTRPRVVWAAFPHKEKRMSREDDFDDFTLSPDDMDSGQIDASEPSYDDVEPEPEPPAASPAPAAPAQPAAKRRAKPKRKPAAKAKAKVMAKPKAKMKAKKKAAKPSRKPAARKVAKKKKTAPKKRAKA